ncbi:expressed unknown protein [Seminavis robusta]|uniref:Uncharacterized protein n=1 Tax=Seminavis robusta TaxID=568900 RepID=A0A9N8DVY9_9STRA|nr:expressed unknown protein [Seminavis robusta]|eukprot:Sro287_g108700.1 n/a (554) ;mRNA; f:74887-76548
MSNVLSPEAAAWAASVLVKEMPSKYTNFDNTKGTLQSMGLKFLRKQDLVQIWQRLKLHSFVYDSRQNFHINSSANKDAWVSHCAQFLSLPGASSLTPVGNGNGAVPPAAAASVPPAAASIPAAASMPMGNPHGIPPLGYPYPAGMACARAPWMGPGPPPHYNQPPAFGFPPPGHPPFHQNRYPPYPGYPPAPAPATIPTAATLPAAATGPTRNPTIHSASRKRKSPATATATAPPVLFGGASDPFLDFMAGALASSATESGSASSSEGSSVGAVIRGTAASAATATEERIWSELKGMGFGESDKQECLGAIRRVMEKNPNPDSMAISIDIITHREEAEEARKMDMARAASEADRREESQKLRDQRKQDDDVKVLAASLEELKNPSGPENKKLMFKTSWLLRYEKCTPMLQEICNNQQHGETKKSLIEFLKKEKDACKWYAANELPKYWLKFVAGTRMLDKYSTGGSAALKGELETLTNEINEAMCLPSKQNKENIPLIFLNARDKHQTPGEKAAEEDDDDDDVILVLDESEIRRTSQSAQDLKPGGAALIEMS